ncbi:S8 family peptidase [Roseibium sediminicola]|uniref:S8 family peptidase n=1 Tax=Roseibium sediminicola TaxID=2933272 RepID=A0ABT0GZY6_9HYPH|nr:S8 family peptidase [Roseibium sp. CAU 1639]MCK7615003.1 S8 family peptidase [Roseibium sp. CAU 1639]
MNNRNYLLGRGERLAENVIVKSGAPDKHAPYSFYEARERLRPMLQTTVAAVDALPDAACPDDQAVVSLTLNPEYIAKSYFPVELLKNAGLEAIGSKPRRITPEKKSKGREPEPAVTTELFVMGTRQAFRSWQSSLPTLAQGTRQAEDLVTIEEITAPSPSDKIKGVLPPDGIATFEVVLHANQHLGESRRLHQFRQYLNEIGIDAEFEQRFYAGGLCFVGLEAPIELAETISTFTAVRALREMPRLRMLRPTVRTTAAPAEQLQYPTDEAIDPELKVAIFDGGLPDNHAVTAWATPIDATGVGGGHDDFTKHGLGVTSAFLFGHLRPGEQAPRPYANVDHYRVLDTEPGQNPKEMYEVLWRVDQVLNSQHYDFVNLSIGPELPIEDDELDAWTAILDERFSGPDTLATIAAGNGGDRDAILGYDRVQVPADCVNAIAVGACDRTGKNWNRASYSSVGPGRSPGLIKPDLVGFGGSLERPFLVASHKDETVLEATGGTSFAAPALLRLGAGIKAHLGANVNLLTTRTLMVHTAERGDRDLREVGWGRAQQSLDDILTVPDDSVRVLYQGEISPGKFLRLPVPLPDGVIEGMVEVTATLCFKSQTDPHHPSNYTRSGLIPTFRPHDGKYKAETQKHPNPKSFFSDPTETVEEEEVRRDAWKWENCLHRSRRFRGSSFSNPCFDVHYNARMESRNASAGRPLPYSMVVTVRAKKVDDFYNQVVRKYATMLEVFRPVIDIPVQT